MILDVVAPLFALFARFMIPDDKTNVLLRFRAMTRKSPRNRIEFFCGSSHQLIVRICGGHH